jgi:hypothetical protein
LISYGNQGGVSDTTPILSELQRLLNARAIPSTTVTAFQTLLPSVVSQYNKLTDSAYIPDNVTLSQLKQMQQVFDSRVQNKLTNLQNSAKTIGNTGSSSGTGGLYDF